MVAAHVLPRLVVASLHAATVVASYMLSAAEEMIREPHRIAQQQQAAAVSEPPLLVFVARSLAAPASCPPACAADLCLIDAGHAVGSCVCLFAV